MLKDTVLFLFLISSSFLLFFGGELADNDARRIITQYLGYPKLLMTIIHPGPAGSPDVNKFKGGINKLINEGYIKSAPQNSAKDKLYEPTSKGAGYITEISVKDSFPLYEGAVCREVVRKIDSIEMDKKGDTAVITFTLGLEPVEPFYGLFCINRYCDYFGPRLAKTEKQKLRLKKAGKGWRITS